MRFLFAPFPMTGHVSPGLSIARELVRRGNEVRWYTTPRFRRAVEAAGATYVPFRHAYRLDEEILHLQFPERPQRAGIRQLRYDIEHLFLDTIAANLRDLEDDLAEHPVDVVVGDTGAVALWLLHERKGIPWAVYGTSVLVTHSRDAAPFGLGLLPSSAFFGRLRNRALNWLTDSVLFRRANRRMTRIRREHGLPPSSRSLFNVPCEADIYLQGSSPSFEYPRTDLPRNVRFIGATTPQPSPSWTPPAWWPELTAGAKVVLVTQGTFSHDFDELLRPAIRALAEQNVLVVATTGSCSVEEAELGPLPANVRAERFVPFARLMPHVDLVLTNGGYGTVQIALAHGVPVVAIGKSEDKAEVANRVEWCRVGRGLKAQYATETQVRDAVAEVLTSSAFATRAGELRAEMSGMDAAARAASHLEELASGPFRSLARIA